MLDQALESIAGQAFRDTEILVVDDGSTDSTAELMEHWRARLCKQTKGSCLTYLQQTNQGAPVARNLGIERSTGDCILFLDSDDLLSTDGLASVMARFRASNADYLHAKVQEVDRLGMPLSKRPIGSSFAETGDGLVDYSWHTMGAVYRRACIERAGKWTEQLTGSQDWEYQVRVKLFGGRGEFIDVVMGYWRQHDAGRVGTEIFRPDYTESVVRACLLIAANARKAGRYDRAIQRRLAKRLLVPALRLGAHGCISRKKNCLKRAREVAGSNQMLRLSCFLLRFTPQRIDSLLVRGHDAQRLKNALKQQ
jgi:glycosyltransferase involved in cell wall biosynthesis